MALASTLDLEINEAFYHSMLSPAPSTRSLALERSLPFTVSSGSECKCDYIDWGWALHTIWPCSTESTWGGALCWQTTKQGTRWTPGQIKIHQDIWIGCPVSKLFVGIKSEVKWNVPLSHISVIILVLERAWDIPEWKNLLNWPVWLLIPQKVVIRCGEQLKRLEMETPCHFFSGHRPAQCGFGEHHPP